MATRMTMKPCRKCKKSTMHVQPSTSHLLHLVLAILTFGFWLLPWLIVAANNGTKAQCTECGRGKGVFG
jgi:hypothetical protein